MFKLNRQTIVVIFVHSIAHFVFMFIVWRPSYNTCGGRRTTTLSCKRRLQNSL